MTRVVIKWSKWLSIAIAGLLALIFITIGWLLFTNSGLNIALWGAEKFVPQLKVESAKGAIFPRFTLNNVTFKDESLNVDTEVEALTLAVNASCFTEPRVCIDEVAIDGLRFAMPELPPSNETVEEEPASTTGKVTSPVPIVVQRIALTDIDLDVLGNKVTWESFTSGLSFQGNRLRVTKTQLTEPVVKLAPTEEPTNPEPESSNAAPTAIELPEVELPLQVDVVRLDIHNFKLEQETPVIVHHLGLSALAKEFKVDVRTLELDMPQAQATLATHVELRGDYPLTLNLDATVKEEIAAGQTLSLKADGSVADLGLEATLGGLAKAKLSAQLQPLKPELPFDIELRDGDVQWPLTGKGDYFVAIDHLNAKGSLDGYKVDLATDIQGKDLPDLAVSLNGDGDLNHITLEKIDLATLGGHVTGDVMANWQQPINWAANLNLSHIQPGLQWPEAEGDISGKLSTSGSLTEQGGWKVDVPTLDIDGILRDYPLNIEGALAASDSSGKGELSLNTPRLVLSHGPNRIEARGQLDKQWQMELAIDFPELVKSVPELKGQIAGKVSLRGALKEPEVGLDLDVKSIDWQGEAKVEQVTLKGDITPLPEPVGNLALKVKNAQYQENVLDDVALLFNGSQKQHQLKLDVTSNIVSTSLALNGSLKNEPDLSWKGELERMSLSSKQGEWRLNQPTALGFENATQQVAVAAHCWLQGNSSLCLDKDIEVGQSGEAALTLSQFDFSQVAALVPETTELTGETNAKVWAKWSPELPPQLKASIDLPKGQVIQKLEQPITLGWESITLNAELAENKLQADWLFDITDNGDVSGKVTIPDVLVDDKQIDGQLKLSTFNLDFLAPVIGDFSQLKSNISTDLAITGPVMQPKVNGKFLVDDILLKGDISPVEVDSGRLTINFTGYDATLAAAIHTPDGKLEVAGDADWHDLEDWSSNVRVFAEELYVDVPPMVKMKVQPDMTISASPKHARVDGDIALPWGRIVVEALPPSAIGISKDQVLLNEQLKPIDEENTVPFVLETNINIKIGDDFKLSAFGLEGGLVGKLNVAQKDKGPFITGEINITDGSYSSFGQDLLIQEGKILMNGPVDQPYVQISAIRNPDNTQDDVTAGVKVTGPASEPTVTIFSDPAMPQANALSYLLRGQDIDGEAGGNSMTTTLIGLSLAKSGRVVGEIGEAFGVQDLQLDTAGSGDDSQVTVSGYVLPGLQVKYGVGIFDSVGEFTVRYRLMQDLYVEAMSGVDSAVDLLYQFEFN
ncbi:translocation/assembly module TamB [Vibrio aquaticus]|uniref:Translocation/assembly module TamB n=1 Tax=Vibrio aquaticus TaxID=2496559 RepID=A0A3S0PLQ0_9VIBR|nr:translocation/assembly module TamB domain-containing protein [Vibrio aquaticus]RTZ14287.1 translocation/assembly module TamB [Vibrio aquaticus]